MMYASVAIGCILCVTFMTAIHDVTECRYRVYIVHITFLTAMHDVTECGYRVHIVVLLF